MWRADTVLKPGTGEWDRRDKMAGGGSPAGEDSGATRPEPRREDMELGRILIIDDNEDMLLAMRMFLKHHAERVDIEPDPNRIPELLGGQRYGLILLDMNFTQDTTSGKEGFYWLNRILEIEPAAVVVMVTGYGDVDMAVESVKSGATDFVLKPFQNEKLLEVCRKAVRQGRPFGHETRQRKFLENEMATAQQVQGRLFPQTLPAMRRLEYTAVCRTAMDTGGDYYDFLPLADGRLGIALGDVSGKGVSAALLMSNLQGRLQSFAPLRTSALDQLMADINQSMCRATESARYATFFYGLYDEPRGTLTYVNAGHHAPMLFRSGSPDGPLRLQTGGMVIGLFPDAAYRQESLPLRTGDLLVIFTDGLVEAANREGEEFGEDRIAEVAARHRDGSATEIQESILAAAEDFRNGAALGDDLTLLVAKVR